MTELPIFKFALREDLIGVERNFSFLPSRATVKATGYDVRAALLDKKPLILRAGQYAKIPLGFRTLSPDGWWLELRPRSSTFAKKQLHSLYGVIDEDYEGQCLFCCQYIPDIASMGSDVVIEFGDAIGQIIPVERKEMTVLELSNEEMDQDYKERNYNRGAAGFGSTGK
jgi:dUTPase